MTRQGDSHLISQSGYSLIELLTACSLAGVVMATALPQIPKMMASFALQNAVFEVTSDLRLARERAITTNAHGRVVFSSETYRLRRESPAGSGTYVNDGALRSLPDGIGVSASPSDPIFDSRGLTTQPYTITVQNGYGTTKTITVTGIGRINAE